jgi:hypothetical protein
MRVVKSLRVLAFSLAVASGIIFSMWAGGASERLELRPDKSRTRGTWEIDLKRANRNNGGLNIEIHESRSNSRWQWINADHAPRIEKKKNGDVDFVIASDAGELVFHGAADGNTAAGDYKFEANEAFSSEAGKLLKRDLSPEDLLEMGFADVTIRYIKDVEAAGITLAYEDVLTLRRYGLQKEALKEFVSIGFNKTGDIVNLRNHGVSADFARKTRELDYGKSVEELVRLRNFGITPEYLKSWKDAGFGLDAEEVVRVRNHGLQADYAAAWKKAGFDFSTDELIRARNSGVPSDFAGALAASGSRPTLDEAIRLRQFGVNADYFREMKKLNPKYTTEEIVKFRQHGVQPEYVRDLGEGGRFSAEQIVKLRNSGVPANYVAALNVEGRKPLEAEAIIELRNRGVSAETARKLRE